MIILDTHVISEPMKPSGNPLVQQWLDQQVAETLFLTTTNLAELLVGIAILPDGNRKQGLDVALKELILMLFGARILPFDQEAAISSPSSEPSLSAADVHLELDCAFEANGS